MELHVRVCSCRVLCSFQSYHEAIFKRKKDDGSTACNRIRLRLRYLHVKAELEVARVHAKVMSHDEVTYVITADTLS